MRYRTFVNDDQLVVLHQQSVDTEDTPAFELSLCPGVPEADMSELISQCIPCSLLRGSRGRFLTEVEAAGYS